MRGGTVLHGENERVGRSEIAMRDQHMGPNVSVFYRQDGGLVVTSGTGSYLRDVEVLDPTRTHPSYLLDPQMHPGQSPFGLL